MKKLALAAGAAAAMAGSIPAHAIIQAVPAPAQLVPLFYWSIFQGPEADFPGFIDTVVRIITPKAVGYDTVINIMNGNANPPPAFNNNTAQTFQGVQQTINGNTYYVNNIHWFWMTPRTTEFNDGPLTVTPDDEVYISAAAVAGVDFDLGTGDSLFFETNGRLGYLVLVNESTLSGVDPQFNIGADAWLWNNMGSDPDSLLPDVSTIPVLPMTDLGDLDAQYPTPKDNVVIACEDCDGAQSSPIHSGIRTSSTNSGYKFRVVDVPMLSSEVYRNNILVWTDKNDTYEADIWNVNSCEVAQSRPKVSIDNELQIYAVGTIPGLDDYILARDTLHLAASDVPESLADFYDEDYIGFIGNNNLGKCTDPNFPGETGFQNDVGAGFVKMVVKTLPLPAGVDPADPAQAGAYSSIVVFNLPSAFWDGRQDWFLPAPDTQLAIDTGFFR
jgi:hypothetical protein